MLLHILSSSLHQEKLTLPFELPQSFLETNQVVAVLTGGTESQFVQLVYNCNASTFPCTQRTRNYDICFPIACLTHPPSVSKK